MRAALAVLLVACLASHAHAGRSFYGWLYGTEVLPERGVELQTWIHDETGKSGVTDKETWLWWGPLVGVTDQLELALPIEMEWLNLPEDNRAIFTFRRFGVEARYRLASPDPIEASPIVPLVRIAAKRDVRIRDSFRLEADVSVSYELGRLHALVDVGFIADISASTRHAELRPGGGVSVRVVEDLRIGAEAYSEISLDNSGTSWAVVGPNLAWTHGRFWVSGMFGIGVYHVELAPRVMWGIAF